MYIISPKQTITYRNEAVQPGDIISIIETSSGPWVVHSQEVLEGRAEKVG